MARVSTLNVSLTAHQRQLVDECVASGRYESASEVVREGLRLLEAQRLAYEASWSEVRAKVAEAQADVDNGRVVDGPMFMRELIKRIDPRGGLRPRKTTKGK